MILAITGATGFVGGHLVDAVLAGGHAIKALTRRPPEPRSGVAWIQGDLADLPALDRLVAGSNAVIHVAGVTNAPSRASFDIGNVAGTAAVLAAAAKAGVRRFVHVSSLAARLPELSMYGASKAGAEGLVRASGLDWTIVRPPAVYGPGDRDMLALFQAVRRGFAPAPTGRFSVIHARDLAQALLAAAGADLPGATFEVDDGAPLGHSHGDFAQSIAAVLGRPVRLVRVSPLVLRLGAAVDTLGARLTRRSPRLSFDRARYIAHPDWCADPALALPAALWMPALPLADGVRDTAEWYRAQGWL